MRSARPAVLAVSLLFAAGVPPALGAVTVMPLDHPLARPGGTTPLGIDGNRIVGTYFDSAAVQHAFVFDGTNWQTLDAPDAARGTAANGVSGNLVCGTYVTASGQTLGFLYDGTNWTTIEHPPLGIGRPDTFARGIEDGTVVGYFIESAVARGFVYSGGNFTDISFPGALGTLPDDIGAGRIVGNFDDLLTTHGFIYDSPTWLPLDNPLGIPLGTFLTGVDGPNVVGNYVSLLDGAGHAFLFDGTGFEPIDVPGARDTTVNGIDGLRVVGVYTDDAGNTQGFVATIPEPTGIVAAMLCLSLALGRRR